MGTWWTVDTCHHAVGSLSNKHEVSLPLSIYTLNELLNCCCCQYSASSLASVSVSGIISGLILRLCPRQCGAARKCEMWAKTNVIFCQNLENFWAGERWRGCRGRGRGRQTLIRQKHIDTQTGRLLPPPLLTISAHLTPWLGLHIMSPHILSSLGRGINQ